MKGCRPLVPEEESQVLRSFSGPYAARDRAIYVLGTKSGFRITELLSLRLKDVIQYERIVDRLYVQRKNLKKRLEGRSVILHSEAKRALEAWIAQLRELGYRSEDTFVFQSRKGANRPISRVHYYKILSQVFNRNGLSGKLGTHTMRKTFANKVYNKLNGALVKTARALGHRNINSTVQYLSFREEEIDDAILNS